MRALLVLLAVAAFGAAWLYVASDSWMFWPGLGIVAFILFRVWRELESVQKPSRPLSMLSARLGLPLRWSWGVGTDVGSAERGIGLQRRADGQYQGLTLRYTDDADWSRFVLEHAIPLGVGVYGDFNVGWLSKHRHARPFGARKLAGLPPGVTCYAVAPGPATRLLRAQPIREALERLRHAVERLEAGIFIFDDRAVTVVSRTTEGSDDLLAAMHQLSTALQEAAPPRGATAAATRPSTGAVFTWVVVALMAILAALTLLGVIR